MITEEELDSALGGEERAPAGANEEGRYPCPDCERDYANPGALYNHRRNAHNYGPGPIERKGKGAQARSSRQRKPTQQRRINEPNPDEEVATAVANTQGLSASLIYVMAPHLGVTIAGYTDEQGNEIVKSRAVMAGELLLPLARKNPRVLQWIMRYNQLFIGNDALNVVGSVAAAGYVDVAATSALIASQGDPHAAMAAAREAADVGVKIGPVAVQPVKMMIPEVLAFVQAQQEQQAAAVAAQPSRNGRSRRRKSDEVEVVEGGVKGT